MSNKRSDTSGGGMLNNTKITPIEEKNLLKIIKKITLRFSGDFSFDGNFKPADKSIEITGQEIGILKNILRVINYED